MQTPRTQIRSQGIIWGAGPVFLFSSATHPFLDGGKWGAGPTVVALKQTGGWTVGVLANHIWSFAGDDDRNNISDVCTAVRVLHHEDAHELHGEYRGDLRWNASQGLKKGLGLES